MFDLPPPTPEQITQSLLGLAAMAVFYVSVKTVKAVRRRAARIEGLEFVGEDAPPPPPAPPPPAPEPPPPPPEDPLVAGLLALLAPGRESEWKIHDSTGNQAEPDFAYFVEHRSGVSFKVDVDDGTVRFFRAGRLVIYWKFLEVNEADRKRVSEAALVLYRRLARRDMLAALAAPYATATPLARTEKTTVPHAAAFVRAVCENPTDEPPVISEIPLDVSKTIKLDWKPLPPSAGEFITKIRTKEAGLKSPEPNRGGDAYPASKYKFAILHRSAAGEYVKDPVATYGTPDVTTPEQAAARFVKSGRMTAPGQYQMWLYENHQEVGWSHPCASYFDSRMDANPYRWEVGADGVEGLTKGKDFSAELAALL